MINELFNPPLGFLEGTEFPWDPAPSFPSSNCVNQCHHVPFFSYISANYRNPGCQLSKELHYLKELLKSPPCSTPSFPSPLPTGIKIYTYKYLSFVLFMKQIR